MGGYCGQFTNQERLVAIDHYAQDIGLAFQVVDDILDTEADTQTLGKTAGKDAQHNKPTYVTILGLTQAKQLAMALHHRAIEALANFGDNAIRLRQLATFITQRSF
jgi:farnesyl diphosphate synthase